MTHDNHLNRKDEDSNIFSRARRFMMGLGLGAAVFDPAKEAPRILPSDKVFADDLARAARMGAMTGLDGARMRSAGMVATMRPAARKSPAEISPLVAGMVSGAIHARYGSAIGDDFDGAYLRNSTISRRELVERRHRHWSQQQA